MSKLSKCRVKFLLYFKTVVIVYIQRELATAHGLCGKLKTAVVTCIFLSLTPSAENHFQSTYLCLNKRRFHSSVKKHLQTLTPFSSCHNFRYFNQSHLSYTHRYPYICLLEVKFLNLGLLSLALGKEPLEKDWL